MNNRFALCLVLMFGCIVSTEIFAATNPTYNQGQQIPPKSGTSNDGSVRVIGNTPVVAPYSEVVKLQTMQMPEHIEKAYHEGYGQVEVRVEVTAGFYRSSYCGGFLVNEKEGLVITCWHGMPPYRDQLVDKYISFRGVPARLVASVPTADLAMLRIEKVPEGMHELPYREPVVGDSVAVRSLQTMALGDITRVADVVREQYFFRGEITLSGQVLSKGTIVLPPIVPSDNTPPSGQMRVTPYQMILTNLSTEPGFSGSPVFSEWGQVIGTVTSGGSGSSFISSAANFQYLFAEYEASKTKKRK